MSDISELSISFSPGSVTPIELNSTKDLMHFYSKNNITLSTLHDTYNLMGKNKSKYFVKKDINSYSKLEYKMFIECEKCCSYKCFRHDRKKICDTCLRELTPLETNYFVYIPVKAQIQKAIGRNFQNILDYSTEMNDKDTDSIYDIHSGSVYKNMEANLNKNNETKVKVFPISFTVNIDGVQIFNIQTSNSLWPIQLINNGLDPKIRFLPENIMVAGLYYGKSGKLPIHSFFQPLCEDFLEISGGLQINGHENIVFIPIITHASLDLPARSKLQCFNQYNCEFGCNYCYIKGVAVRNKKKTRNVLRFLYGNSPLNIRTHDETLEIMANLKLNDKIHGFEDISPLASLDHFDLINSFAFDYLHGILKGPFEKLMDLFLSTANKKEPYYLAPRKRQILEKRIKNFKGIKEMGKVRNIDKVNSLKCYEQRIYLLYLLPIFLQGLLPTEYLKHFNSLSSSIYILLKEKITITELNRCENTLNEFVKSYEELFGKTNVTIYTHMIRHIVSSVRCLGPLWSFSTFSFESNGGALKRLVQGSNSVLKQITRKYILNQSLIENKSTQLIVGSKLEPIGTSKVSNIDSIHKDAFNEFPNINPLRIYTSIQYERSIYSSTHHRTISTIDYFLLLENGIIVKAIYYFEHQRNVYLLAELYNVLNENSHLKEIESGGIFLIKRADTIKDKLIYVNYKVGIDSTRQFVSARPNKFERM